jgi:hypothetical protein
MTTPKALPFKSVAGALLFCAILGPVGVLYSSVIGGIVMIIIGLLVLRAKLMGPILIVWLISCVWGVAAANRYNDKLL